MTVDQAIVFAIIGGALLLFVSNLWRFDLVAIGALLAGVLTGVVPQDRAFSGFSNPAVITVVAVLIISRALATSGVVDLIAAPADHARHQPVRAAARVEHHRRGALGVHEQRRRARAAHAGGARQRPQVQVSRRRGR